MSTDYIIVQAGGKGTRLEYLTKNKPKALVTINNLPMIFHLFELFSDKKFIIIADYKKDVLIKYLDVFANVEYIVVDAYKKGTCAGIKDALSYIPNNKSFMLIWSDLILNKDFKIPNIKNNYIGISKDFECRWSYKDNQFIEEKSSIDGVAGLFIFEDKQMLIDVPGEGEFVRYLSNCNFNFKRLDLFGTKEYGTLIQYNSNLISKCRSFNKTFIKDNKFIKKPINKQGKDLSINEINWYKYLENKNYKYIPKIYDYNPLTMEYLNGKNIYELSNCNLNEKKIILTKIIESLNELHDIEKCDVDYFSVFETYINKTFDRIDRVRNLIPFANDKDIVINNKSCPNIFFYKDEVIKKIQEIKCDKFCVIHGDVTFSNIIFNNDNEIVLIDPRGYFGNSKIFGDVNYDWAKLYYSIVGDYDNFNLGNFNLDILENKVEIKIDSCNFSELEDFFFELTGCDKKVIKLLHSLIWLSLTTYTWQNYDSICGAFYNGLYYLEEVL